MIGTVIRVLVACECSGVVRKAFSEAGCDAWSCDLEPSFIPSGKHITGDVREHLNNNWDLMIAHPPCTYLCSSGLHWNHRTPGRQIKTEAALEFVKILLDAPVPHIALENPVGCISTRIRKPDQTIQPYQFGHAESKGTCLWLKSLPPLIPAHVVDPSHYGCKCGARFDYAAGAYGCPNCLGQRGPAKPIYSNQTPSGQNKLGPSAKRSMQRSVTYKGIAEAMAAQWVTYIRSVNP